MAILGCFTCCCSSVRLMGSLGTLALVFLVALFGGIFSEYSERGQDRKGCKWNVKELLQRQKCIMFRKLRVITCSCALVSFLGLGCCWPVLGLFTWNAGCKIHTRNGFFLFHSKLLSLKACYLHLFNLSIYKKIDKHFKLHIKYIDNTFLSTNLTLSCTGCFFWLVPPKKFKYWNPLWKYLNILHPDFETCPTQTDIF